MPLRLAIVGCGAIAEMGHIPAARRLETVRLTALVDSDKKRAEHLAEQFEVPKAFNSLSEISSEVDAVVLATPPHIRPALAEQAFSAGLHVLCEKPLATSAAGSKIILEAGKRAKRILAVAHTHRYLPNRIHVHRLLQERALGKVTAVDVEQGNPSDWPTRTGYALRREFTPGGVLLNDGIHSLDTLFWWFGSPLNFEYEDDAIGGIESNVRIRMKLANDILCNFRLSRTCPLENRVTIKGETGSVVMPIWDQAQFVMTRNGRPVTHSVTSSKWDLVGVVREQLRDFVGSIQTMGAPRVTGEDGLRVVNFIEECYGAKHQRTLPLRAPVPGSTW